VDGPPAGWDGYAAAWARLHGGFDPRQASLPVRGWLRMAYAIGAGLGRLGVSPTAVTAAGVVLSVAVPLLAAQGPGWPVAAAGVVLLCAVADSADGAVAVVTGRATRLGYVYDSLADRVGEVCWALALWAVGAPWPLATACAALSWLHEYARARATGAGMAGIGAVTSGERPTRALVSLIGLLLAGLAGLVAPEFGAGVATIAGAVWLLIALFGLGQLLKVIRAELR
jgi:CDP-diacylglycerol--glycerol-3-phosphate 3-phosphatidyltransferase